MRPPASFVAVERVQRAAPDVHHVVRHVDDVRDRAHLGEEEARAQPLRRRADRDVAEDAADVARAAVEVLDRDVDLLGVDDGGIVGLGRMELATEERRDLARDADHREQVDAVHRRRDVEHLVADREHVDERRSRLGAVGENHDPRVVVSEADLVLGQDHPARRLPAKLALVERLVEDRQERARQRDRDGRARLEVPRAAHDLARVTLPHVDLAHAQPVGVRMRVDRRARGRRGSGRGCRRGPATPTSITRSTSSAEMQSRCSDLLGGRVDGDVLAQPRERSTHQNCPSKRGSLRQSSRRSGIPWRSTAIRSSPQPNAKPV